MILAPALQIGWNGVYQGPARYFAAALGSPINTFRISEDGAYWSARPLRGDIADYPNFTPNKAVVHAGKIILVGYLSGNGAAIFVSSDGEKFDRVVTSVDGTGTSKQFVDVASNGTIVCALMNTGERAISANGSAWTGYANLGFSGVAALSIAASGAVFVAVGSGSQIFTTSNPAGSWAAQSSPIASVSFVNVVAGNVFVAMDGGGGIVSSPLTGTSWSLRSNPDPAPYPWLAYGGGRWLAGGYPADKLITSLNGTLWTKPSVGHGMTFGARSGLWDGAKWVLTGAGEGAIGNGVDWTAIPKSGLANANYVVAVRLPS